MYVTMACALPLLGPTQKGARRMNVEPGTGRGVRPGGSKERDAVPAVRQQWPVPKEIRALSTMADPDYVDLFTMAGGIPGRSPEQWARAMFEDVLGRDAQFVWRVLMGLRLKAAPERVARWKIADRGDNWVRLEASSWFLTNHLVVRADDEQVSLATFIRYDRPVASRVWPPMSTKHRQYAPGLLRQAYRASSRGRADRPARIRVQHHELELTKAAMGDHCADHKQNPADGSHRHHDRCHVEHGRQDQANRSQELKDPKGLDEADAGVPGPFPAIVLSQFLLENERLGDAAD
jgi:hypothetical protein